MEDSQLGVKRVSSPDAPVNLALLGTGGFGVIASLVGLLGWDLRVSFGVFVGALLALGNLWAFRLVGRGFFSGDGSSRAVWGLIGAFKFVGLLVIVAVLVRCNIVGAIPLAVGYGALPLGIAVSGPVSARFADEPIHGDDSKASGSSHEPHPTSDAVKRR